MWILTNLHDRLGVGELADGGLAHGLAGPGDLGDGEHGQHVAGLLPGVHPGVWCLHAHHYKRSINPGVKSCVDICICVVCGVKYFLQHSDKSFMITAAGGDSS